VDDIAGSIADAVKDAVKDRIDVDLSSGSSSSSKSKTSSSTSKTRFLASFYGLGGAGGFHQDWLEKIARKAGSKTKSAVHFYDHDEVQEALTDLFSKVDINDDHVISKSELKKVQVRAVGYSLGGIAATNFTRELNRAGDEVAGYRLEQAIKVKRLVTIDPVNHASPLPHTDGPLRNVDKFINYYQQRGGETKIDVLERRTKIKLTSITVEDPFDFVGGPLESQAKKTKQRRVDTGSWGKKKITQDLESGVLGRMRGRDVNHGTITWFVYKDAVKQLK
jgi:hypothetical protein